MSVANLVSRIDGARNNHQKAKEQFAEARESTKPQEVPSPEKKGGISLSDIGHTALDIAGFIPIFGAAADLANAAWYAAEGDYVNASLSAVSAVPGVGDAAAAGKVVLTAATAVKGTSAIAAAVAFAGRGKKTFINYTLREADGAVRYVGRASGRGTPEQVMARRISKGHKVAKANPHLTPKIESVQGNRAANLGGEDVLYEYHKREGADLLNNSKSPPLSSSPRKIRKTRGRIEAYAEDLKSDFEE